MDILKLAKNNNINIPEIIEEYSNILDNDLSIDDNLELIKDIIFEYADSRCPIYYSDIDSQYKDCSYSIDNVISEGLIESMKNESDISKCKQIAIFMEIEQKTHEELNSFLKELKEVEEEELSLIHI